MPTPLDSDLLSDPLPPLAPASPTAAEGGDAGHPDVAEGALQALRLLPDEPQRGLALLDSLLPAARHRGDPRLLLRLEVVGLHQAARQGDRHAAAHALHVAREQAQAAGWRVEQLLAELGLLFLQTLGDDHAAGLQAALALQPAVERHLHPVEQSLLDIMLGHFQGYVRGWAEAQQRAYVALQRLADCPEAPPGLVANLKKNIGYSHLLVQNVDLARNFLAEAHRLYQPLPLTPRKLHALKCWAQCLLELGLPDEADTVLSPVLDEAVRQPVPLYLASALLVGAEVAVLRGQLARAEQLARHAGLTLDAAQEPGVRTHAAYVHALRQGAAGEHDEALRSAQRACDIAPPNTHELAVQKSLALAARLHAECGHFAKAYALQAQLLQMRAEMAGKAAVIRHVELHIAHEARIARLELAHSRRARQQAQEAEAAIARQNRELAQRLRDVEQLQDSLREQANRDALTGLFNRRYLWSAWPGLQSLTRRARQPLTLCLLDIDHFKQVNDQHGHAAGDAVLVRLAALMGARFRGHDLSCRYGGEEFCLVLPGLAAAEAQVRIEQLRLDLGAQRIDAAEGLGALPQPLSFSAGLVSLAADEAATLDDALRRADLALYEAKRRGRGCVVVAPSA